MKKKLDVAAILRMYTHHARREMDDSSLRREAAPPVVRYVNDDAPHSMILAADLVGISDSEVGEIAEREKAYFTASATSLNGKCMTTTRRKTWWRSSAVTATR